MAANTTLRLAVTWYVPYECGDSSNELTLAEVEVRPVLYCTVLYCTVLYCTGEAGTGPAGAAGPHLRAVAPALAPEILRHGCRGEGGGAQPAQHQGGCQHQQHRLQSRL